MASKAAITPVKTSPDPAVASRASPLITQNTFPPGSATTVVEPFKRTTAFRVSAALRVSAMRSALGRSPVSALNSPSCGVSTVSAVR